MAAGRGFWHTPRWLHRIATFKGSIFYIGDRVSAVVEFGSLDFSAESTPAPVPCAKFLFAIKRTTRGVAGWQFFSAKLSHKTLGRVQTQLGRIVRTRAKWIASRSSFTPLFVFKPHSHWFTSARPTSLGGSHHGTEVCGGGER